MKWIVRIGDRVLATSMLCLGILFRACWPHRKSVPRPDGEAHWVAIKLVGLGDAVLMLPALAAAGSAPGHGLTVVTTRRCTGVFANPANPGKVLLADPRHPLRTGRQVWAALRDCVGVLDFEQHVFWSSAVAMLAPRRALRIGLRTSSRLRNRAYDRLVDPGEAPRPMKGIFDDLARAAGFFPDAALRPLTVSREAATTVDAWLTAHACRHGHYLTVAPGSGASVGFRRWPADAWAQALGAMPVDLPIVLVGTRTEVVLIGDIQRRLHRPGVAVQTRFSLEQLAYLFAQSWKVVATDSGPMHVAAAMGVPVVGLFGPDTPRRYAPLNSHSVSVTLDLPCSPCNNCFVYREARCTNPDRFACMRRLPPSRVVEAVDAGERVRT